MDPEIQEKIEETVLEILKNSNMDDTTEYKIRQAASEKLCLDLSQPDRKRFVRKVVEAYLVEQSKAEPELDEKKKAAAVEEEEEDDEEEDEARRKRKRAGGAKEYDDNGHLIICKLSARRKVTISDFKGKRYLSMREFYTKNGKDLPGKGISLPAEQWSIFKKNIPAIEKAIRKMESRLN